MLRPVTIQRYSIGAALCLVFSVAAAPSIALASLAVESPLARAAAFLLGPFLFLIWIVTTVRSLHLLGLSYWSLASTYVVLLSNAAAGALACIAGAVHPQGSAGDFNQTLLCAAALTSLIGLGWSAWFNWRKTGSTVLAFGLTVLQLVTAGLIVLLILLRTRPPEKASAA